MGYDWPKIMSSKTESELKKILRDKNTEPLVKVNAAINELKTRELLDKDYQEEKTTKTKVVRERKRFNIERLACMGTVILIIDIFILILADDKSSVLGFSIGACLLLPMAYYAYSYLNNTDAKFEDIFFEKVEGLPNFSWEKYLQEFVLFGIVIVVLLVAGLVMKILEWTRS